MRKILLESILFGGLFFVVAYIGRLPLQHHSFMIPLRMAIVFTVLYLFYRWINRLRKSERRKEKF